ncbi:MAG TPA: hypothetical protein VNA04_08315 [Thermoanaerobaculia bacterium]|nr:hypothetical protein [Thermoanaerobaculia bacterium]
MFERSLLIGGPNVVSLYQRMAQTPSGRAWALAFYEQARPRYDPNTQQHVDRILGVQGSALAAAA